MAQKYILQMLVALFAEDIGLPPKYFVTNLLAKCKIPADGYDIICGLFEAMYGNPPKFGGRFKGVSYVNDGLCKILAAFGSHRGTLFRIQNALLSETKHAPPANESRQSRDGWAAVLLP
jgi:hypothetical protein